MNKIYDVLSDVVDNGLDIVFVYDKFGKILWANKMMENVTFPTESYMFVFKTGSAGS